MAKTTRRQRRNQPQRLPLTAAVVRSRIAELDGQRRRLAGRAKDEIAFITPLIGGQARLAESDIPYSELWAEVHWTEEAAERIRNDEFRYISPEFDMDHTDPGTGDKVGASLLAIGLVTRPFLKGMAKIEDPDEDDVSAVQVFMTGEWHHEWYGRITIEPRHFDEMLDNFSLLFSSVREESAHDNTEMVVDYNHQSLYGGPDESKAAGWVRGAKLYVVEPEEARKAASEPGATPVTQTGAKTMKDARIRELLKLSEDTAITDEHRADVLELLDNQNAELAGKVEELTPAEDKDEDKDEPEAYPEADPAAEQTGELTAENVAELREQAAEGAAAAKTLRERDARDAVRLAEEANRLLPAQRSWAEGYALADPAGFAAFVEHQPEVVPLGVDGANGDSPASSGGAVKAFIDAEVKGGMSMAEAQRAAHKKFGADAFAEYRKPAAS